jgi:hypothetical protein
MRASSRRSISVSAAAAVQLPGSLSLMERVQHNHWNLAFGLELIVGIGRPKFERLFPKSDAFLAARCPSPRLQLLGPDLHLDIRVCEDIAVPSRVLGRAAL